MGCGAATARRYAAMPLGHKDLCRTKASTASPFDRGRWFWEEVPGVWQAYDPLVNDKLLAACDAGESRLAFVLDGLPYEVNFLQGTQTRWDTGAKCRVRHKGPALPIVYRVKTAEEDCQGGVEHRHHAPGCWQIESVHGIWKSVAGDAAKLLRAARARRRSRVVHESHGRILATDLDALVQIDLQTGMKQRLRWMPHKQFQWQLKNGIWVDYDDEENDVLASALAEGQRAVIFAARGFEYKVNLEDMCQENKSTPSGTLRKVRIVGADVLAATIEGKNKKQAEAERLQTPPTGYRPQPRQRPQSAQPLRPQSAQSLRPQSAQSVRREPQFREPQFREPQCVHREPQFRDSWEPPQRERPKSPMPTSRPRSPMPERPQSSPMPGRRSARPASASPPFREARPAWGEEAVPSRRHSQRSNHADKAFQHFAHGGPEAWKEQASSEGESPPRAKRWSFARHPNGAPAAPGPRPRVSEREEAAPPHRRDSNLPPFGAQPPYGAYHSAPPHFHGSPQGGHHGIPPHRAAHRAKSPEPEDKFPKLPTGVELPQEPAARAAARALVVELAGLRGASTAERRKAYRQACLRWHPDKNPQDEDVATDVFQFLQDLKDWCLGDDS